MPDAALAPARDLVAEGLRLGPVIDGDLLPVPTLDAYRAGIGAGVPLVIGATDDEFALVVHGVREPLDALSGREALAALGLGSARARPLSRRARRGLDV